MKPQRIVILTLVALALAFLGWRLLAPQVRPAPTLSGYIEGEALYLSAASAGQVTEVGVRRGQRVEGGARLFQIEPDQQQAQQAQAAAVPEFAPYARMDASDIEDCYTSIESGTDDGAPAAPTAPTDPATEADAAATAV